MEYLWAVAFADENADKHEEYLVRKIANLIGVSHKEFIEAKLRPGTAAAPKGHRSGRWLKDRPITSTVTTAAGSPNAPAIGRNDDNRRACE